MLAGKSIGRSTNQSNLLKHTSGPICMNICNTYRWMCIVPSRHLPWLLYALTSSSSFGSCCSTCHSKSSSSSSCEQLEAAASAPAMSMCRRIQCTPTSYYFKYAISIKNLYNLLSTVTESLLWAGRVGMPSKR